MRVDVARGFLLVLAPAGVWILGCGHSRLPPDPPSTGWITGAEDACSLRSDGGDPGRNPLDDLDLETATLEEGVEALARTTRFGTYRTGFGGSPDAGVLVLEEVLRQPDALSLLDRLWVQGTPAARLYSICGYYVADPVRFEWTSRSLFGRSECTEFLHSCLGSRCTMATALHSAAAVGLLEELRTRVASARSDEAVRVLPTRASALSAAQRATRDLSAWLSCGAVVTEDSTGPAPWTCVRDVWGGITLGRPVVDPDLVFVPIALGNPPGRRAGSFICLHRISAWVEGGRVIVSIDNGSCDSGSIEAPAAYVRRPAKGRYSIVYDDAGAGFPGLGEVDIE